MRALFRQDLPAHGRVFFEGREFLKACFSSQGTGLVDFRPPRRFLFGSLGVSGVPLEPLFYEGYLKGSGERDSPVFS